jgi:tetratricopeptide (TPR) repeat protein
MEDKLSAGIAAAEQGNFSLGKALLTQALREQPNSEIGWLWLGRCLADTGQKKYCFERALAINPKNQEARQELNQMLSPAPEASKPPPAEKTVQPFTMDIGPEELQSPLPRTPVPASVQTNPPAEQPPAQAGDTPPSPPPATPDAGPENKKRSSRWTIIDLLAMIVIVGGMLFIYFYFRPFRIPFLPTAATQPVGTPTITLTPTQSPTRKPSATYTPTLTPGTPTITRTPLITATDASTSHYLNAKNDYEQASNEHALNKYTSLINNARQEIDLAIGLNQKNGDYYALRSEILSAYAGTIDLRADRDYYNTIALDNLKTAVSLGISDPAAERKIPPLQFSLRQCDAGLAEVRQLEAQAGSSAPPNPDLLDLEAMGYLCQGQLEQALASIDRGLAIDQFPDQEWLQAVILYQLGRSDEALTILNNLIKATPDNDGYRYYLRAEIYYEQGKIDLAQHDLDTGSWNNWNQSSLRAYVLGRLALDAGNKQKAIEDYQNAFVTLDWYYQPTLFKQVEKALVDLGGTAPLEQHTAQWTVTPMPTLAITPIPQPVTPASTPANIPTPSRAIPVDMSKGTGFIDYTMSLYPVYFFKPPKAIHVKSVQVLTLQLLSNSNKGATPFKVLLWNPGTGEWVLFSPNWGQNKIDDPSRFVDSQGSIYLAVHYHDGDIGSINNIWFTLYVTLEDGSSLTIDKK